MSFGSQPQVVRFAPQPQIVDILQPVSRKQSLVSQKLSFSVASNASNSRRCSLEDEYDALGRKSVEARLSEQFSNPDWKITYDMADSRSFNRRTTAAPADGLEVMDSRSTVMDLDSGRWKVVRATEAPAGALEVMEPDRKTCVGRTASLASMYDFDSFNTFCTEGQRRSSFQRPSVGVERRSLGSTLLAAPDVRSTMRMTVVSNPAPMPAPAPVPMIETTRRAGPAAGYARQSTYVPALQGNLVDFLGGAALPPMFMGPAPARVSVTPLGSFTSQPM